MPATNVVSERSFSALKPFGTYLRSTTGQARLNHLMRLQYVHKEFADGVDVLAVTHLFVWDNHSYYTQRGKHERDHRDPCKVPPEKIVKKAKNYTVCSNIYKYRKEMLCVLL